MNDKQNLVKIFQSVFGDKIDVINLNQHDNVLWDSVNHMILISSIEDFFNIKFTIQNIVEFDSFSYALMLINGDT